MNTVTRVLVLASVAIALVLGSTAFLQQEKKQESGAPQMKELLARDHSISLKEAKEMIQARNAGMKATELKGGVFNRKIFDKILAQKGCVAIRYYYAQTKDGKPTLVFVGVDAKGKDMTKATMAEKGQPCPPWCDVNTELLK